MIDAFTMNRAAACFCGAIPFRPLQERGSLRGSGIFSGPNPLRFIRPPLTATAPASNVCEKTIPSRRRRWFEQWAVISRLLELHGAGLTVEHLERVGIERPSVVHLIPRCAQGVAEPRTELLRVTEGEDRSSSGPHPNQ